MLKKLIQKFIISLKTEGLAVTWKKIKTRLSYILNPPNSTEGRNLSTEMPLYYLEEAFKTDVYEYSRAPFHTLSNTKVALFVSSQGNFFMEEIALLLHSGFEEAGADAYVFFEEFDSSLDTFDFVVVVAPHEFFPLASDKHLFKRFMGVKNLILFNTEQPQTQWFELAFSYLAKARYVWDIDFFTSIFLRKKNVNSFFFPLGFSQKYYEKFSDTLTDSEFFKSFSPEVKFKCSEEYCSRPIDIMFVGTISPKREKFFAGNGEFFSKFNTFFYIPPGDTPFTREKSKTMDFNDMIGLARRSKIVLNIHRDMEPYFEWQRIVNLGIHQGALVISERCPYNPVVKPGVDFVDCFLEDIPWLCEYYLSHEGVAEEFSKKAMIRARKMEISKIIGSFCSYIRGETYDCPSRV